MAVREILIYPANEAALRKKSEPVGSVNREVKRLIRDLKETLNHHPEGIGLAAPQINVHRRVVIVQLGVRYGALEDRKPAIALVNPAILEARLKRRDFDGCLSFPGLYGETVRPHYLRVAGLNEQGESCEWIFEDFDAVLAHHEIDHLEGVLFIDRIEQLDDLYRISKDENGKPIRIPISTDIGRGDGWTIIRKGRE